MIQKSDFYAHAGILHPLIVGSIAVIALFFYLRLGSNRSVAPITVFDWIINVALGSTLAGIINGNSLVRGLIALATMLGFQYLTSHISSRYHQRFEWIFHAPPLVVAFRGDYLHTVMAKHRISDSDIDAALRQQGLINIKQIEVIIIEANGTFSVFSEKAVFDTEWDPAALMAVPAYKALCEKADNHKSHEEKSSKTESGGTSDDMELQDTESYGQTAVRHERPNETGWNRRSVLPL